MEHLTYAQYTSRGGTAAETAFPMLEARANRVVDTLTFRRLESESPLRDAVQYCLTALINALAADEALNAGTGRDVASVSNDGVSVTFAGASSSGSASMRNAQIVREWLTGETDGNGVHLLYAGVI